MKNEAETKLRSRFSDTVIEAAVPVLLGMVAVDTASRGAFLNSVPLVGPREYLLPDAEGRWTILFEEGAQRITGSFPQHSLPIENDLPSLIGIGELVNATANCCWHELDQIAPTVPDLGTRIRLTSLERAILKYLPYLEEACARPKAYLKFETARVNVSQARRVPARAVPYLAAHTEDWDRPTLRAVRPKRVLAEIREDELDIYENRVAVRLVDRLLRVVQPRIAELRKAQRILTDLLDYSTLAGGSHWRARRICSLWAESVSALQSEKRCRTTLRQLVSMRQRLQALLDSPLYEAIPRRAEVPDALKPSNVLATDPVYRHLAILWSEWSRHTSSRQKSHREVFADYRGFCDSFSTFCLLLVVRALSQFGITAAEADALSPIGRGRRTQLSRPELHLSIMPSGAIRLSAGSDPLITFVPIPAAINRARTDAELEEWVGMIRSDLEKPRERCHTVVLYLSSLAGASRTLSENANAVVWSIGNEPGKTRLRNLGFVPVSPWEIDCVERVARCVRWAITGRDLLRFPAKVSPRLPSALTHNQLPRWVALNQDGIVVLRYCRHDEREKWALDSAWRTAKQTLDTEAALRDQAVERQQRGRMGPQEGKAIAHQVARLRNAVADAQRRFDELDVFRKELLRTLDGTADTSICPVCSSEADLTRGFTSDTRFYEYRCSDCNARWGVRTCSCNQRIPFIYTGISALPSDRSPGWVDRQFGRDVLAVPTGGGAFECSACGAPV